MNIFFLDADINKSAEYHVDKHVVKMRVEYAQLLSTAHWLTGGQGPYKPTHVNHPSAIWVRESLSNYNYVVNLGLALCDELEHRYKTKNQKCRVVLNTLKNDLPNIPDIGLTKPRLAMPDYCKIHDSENYLDFAISNYRNYYNVEKQHIFSWTRRNKPNFIQNGD
jgi:hypothetical protein